MRSVDSSIKLIASGKQQLRRGRRWASWNRTVVSTLRPDRYISHLHRQPANDLERFLGQSQLNLERYIDTTAAIIREAQGRAPQRAADLDRLRVERLVSRAEIAPGRDLPSRTRSPWACSSTPSSAADVVKMANLAQMVNVIAR
jgi:hypothetical protein